VNHIIDRAVNYSLLAIYATKLLKYKYFLESLKHGLQLLFRIYLEIMDISDQVLSPILASKGIR
jgi:hypothetical protein